MSFERSVRRRIRRAEAVEVGRASQTAGECGADWREQGKASLVVARGVCAARERVLVVCCVVGMAMLECWLGGVYRSVGINHRIAWPGLTSNGLGGRQAVGVLGGEACKRRGSAHNVMRRRMWMRMRCLAGQRWRQAAGRLAGWQAEAEACKCAAAAAVD